MHSENAHVDFSWNAVLRAALGKKWSVGITGLLLLGAAYTWFMYGRDAYVARSNVEIGYELSPTDTLMKKYFESADAIERRMKNKFSSGDLSGCAIHALLLEAAVIQISCRGESGEVAGNRARTITSDLLRFHQNLARMRADYAQIERKADESQLHQVRTLKSEVMGSRNAVESAILASTLGVLLDKELLLTHRMQMNDARRALEVATAVDAQGVQILYNPTRPAVLVLVTIVVILTCVFAALAWGVVEALAPRHDDLERAAHGGA